MTPLTPAQIEEMARAYDTIRETVYEEKIPIRYETI